MKLKQEFTENKENYPFLEVLIDHFNYSIADINSYDELTPEEKKFISEDVFKQIAE